MVEFSAAVLKGFAILVIVYFTALNTVYLISGIVAFFSVRRHVRRMKAVDMDIVRSSAGALPVTLLAPAFNEEKTCVQSVKSLLTLEYPDYEILVVNDGSKDATLERLREAYDLTPAFRAPTAELPTAPIRGIYRSRRHPQLWVVDKENGGKADSLNTGLNFCVTPLFCAMDADSLLERDALSRIVRPFLEDARTVAAGGVIRIVNSCSVKSGMVTDVRLPKNWLARIQVLEYLRAYLSGRMGWHTIDATLIISGAFGVFRRSTVVAAGGYATARTSGETVGEDMELVVRLHRYCRQSRIPYQISYMCDPVAWTECPETIRVLGRQRDRWQRGLMEALSRHRTMFFNPRYGVIGLIAFPYFYIFEMLGPVIEMCGYLTFAAAAASDAVSPDYVWAFLCVAFAYGVANSIAAVGLEELSYRRYARYSDLLHLFGLAILENFGYRQMSAWWRFRGTLSALRGAKGWGRMERKGFANREQPAM